jgi:2',3'-cyclic-nucleotide 2'-phosphodiesterase
MKIFFAGDIVGKPGREAVRKLYPPLKSEHSIDLFIANGENVAGGSGITRKIGYELHDAGVDVITLGDHSWKNKDVFNLVQEDRWVIRPANFPPKSPGNGSVTVTMDNGIRVGVMLLIGRIYMSPPVDCPFRAADEQIAELKDKTDLIIIDMHAEATSEKVAMGRYLDGRVTAVLGTHTHIPTADETILPKGTAYITDVGMTGPHDSVLGRDVQPVLKRFITHIPSFFTVAKNDIRISGVILTIDENSKRVTAIERVQKKLNDQDRDTQG